MTVTQDDANYRVAKPEDGANCAQCDNFIAPDKCAAVSGVVAPGGLCDLFKPSADSGASSGGTDSLMAQLFGNTGGPEQ